MEQRTGKYPETVGVCKLSVDKEIIELHKAPYGQGFIFKDWNAFYSDANAPCYVPELSDSIYTHQDFVNLCNGQEDVAKELFASVDWQHPETLLDEWFTEREVTVCKSCDKVFFSYAVEQCPCCGAVVQTEGDDS